MRYYLIVDDDRPLAENLAEIVYEAGGNAAVAGDGRQALALAQHLRFDVVVTDMHMPAMSGTELLQQMRRIDPGVAAIVITAHAGDHRLRAARREGVIATLQKPVPISELLGLLQGARRDGLIVVVEDEPSLCENLCEALRARGFASVTAASIREVEQLGPVEPFCAIVDLCVPGGPAGEAARRLARRWPKLPMLGMTAYPDARQLPCAAVFSKPFDTGLLLDAVEFHYRNRRRASA